jgi:hypothetical protein
MTTSHAYQQVLETSRRVNWRLEDLVGEGHALNFARPFLPETFARTAALGFLSTREKLLLNHIRTRGYLALFELVESFVVPFVSELSSSQAGEDAYSAPALKHFVDEEEKHRKMFVTVLREFDAHFPVQVGFIGPAEAIVHTVLAHSPLAVTIATLGLEWMSQAHYVEAVHDDSDLDPQFKRLLRHHWLEEAQHAKLDTFVLESLAAASTPQAIATAVDEYFEIGAFLDGGLKAQVSFDLAALEAAAGRSFAPAERERFLEVQHAAQRWTFLGTAMGNKSFLKALGAISADGARRVSEAAASLTLD